MEFLRKDDLDMRDCCGYSSDTTTELFTVSHQWPSTGKMDPDLPAAKSGPQSINQSINRL